MKFKRITALILSSVLLLSLAVLSACKKETPPQEIFNSVATDFKEAKSINIKTKYDLKTENEEEKITLQIDGSINNDLSGAKAIITAAIGENIYPLTDIKYTKNKTVYINIATIIDFLNNKEALDILTKIKKDKKDKKENDNSPLDVLLKDFDAPSYIAILASLDLPTYMSFSATNNKVNSNSILATSDYTNEYKSLLELLPQAFATLAKDNTVCTYSDENEILTFTLNDQALNTISNTLYEYSTKNTDNLYNVLLTIIPNCSEDVVRNIYSTLYEILDNNKKYDDYTTFITSNENKIKKLTAEACVPIYSILETELTQFIHDLINNEVAIKINVKDKYNISLLIEDENKNIKSLDFELSLCNEKKEIDAPDNSKSVDKILNSLLSDS